MCSPGRTGGRPAHLLGAVHRQLTQIVERIGHRGIPQAAAKLHVDEQVLLDRIAQAQHAGVPFAHDAALARAEDRYEQVTRAIAATTEKQPAIGAEAPTSTRPTTGEQGDPTHTRRPNPRPAGLHPAPATRIQPDDRRPT